MTEKLTPRAGDVWRDNDGFPKRYVFVVHVDETHAQVQTCDEYGIRTGGVTRVRLKEFSPHAKPRRTGFTLSWRDEVETQP